MRSSGAGFVSLNVGVFPFLLDRGEKTMEIASTDCETYALIVVKMQKKEKTSHLVAMYSKYSSGCYHLPCILR